MLSQPPNLQLKEFNAMLKNPDVQLLEKVALLQKVSNELDRLFSDQLINEILQAEILDEIVGLCSTPIESDDARRGILHFFATLSLAGPSKTKLLLDLGVLSATLAVISPPITPESAKQGFRVFTNFLSKNEETRQFVIKEGVLSSVMKVFSQLDPKDFKIYSQELSIFFYNLLGRPVSMNYKLVEDSLNYFLAAIQYETDSTILARTLETLQRIAQLYPDQSYPDFEKYNIFDLLIIKIIEISAPGDPCYLAFLKFLNSYFRLSDLPQLSLIRLLNTPAFSALLVDKLDSEDSLEVSYTIKALNKIVTTLGKEGVAKLEAANGKIFSNIEVVYKRFRTSNRQDAMLLVGNILDLDSDDFKRKVINTNLIPASIDQFQLLFLNDLIVFIRCMVALVAFSNRTKEAEPLKQQIKLAVTEKGKIKDLLDMQADEELNLYLEVLYSELGVQKESIAPPIRDVRMDIEEEEEEEEDKEEEVKESKEEKKPEKKEERKKKTEKKAEKKSEKKTEKKVEKKADKKVIIAEKEEKPARKKVMARQLKRLGTMAQVANEAKKYLDESNFDPEKRRAANKYICYDETKRRVSRKKKVDTSDMKEEKKKIETKSKARKRVVNHPAISRTKTIDEKLAEVKVFMDQKKKGKSDSISVKKANKLARKMRRTKTMMATIEENKDLIEDYGRGKRSQNKELVESSSNEAEKTITKLLTLKTNLFDQELRDEIRHIEEELMQITESDIHQYLENSLKKYQKPEKDNYFDTYLKVTVFIPQAIKEKDILKKSILAAAYFPKEFDRDLRQQYNPADFYDWSGTRHVQVQASYALYYGHPLSIHLLKTRLEPYLTFNKGLAGILNVSDKVIEEILKEKQSFPLYFPVQNNEYNQNYTYELPLPFLIKKNKEEEVNTYLEKLLSIIRGVFK